MAKIISFATQKGGSGKSTLAILTSTAIANRYGKKILLIDADPQQTVMDIYMRHKDRTKYDVEFFNWNTKSKNDYRNLLMGAGNKYHYIIVDVPGKMGGEEVFNSVMMSDVVCVPVVPRRTDIASTAKFLKVLPKIAEARKKQGFSFDVFGIPNKMDNTIESTFIKKLDGVGGLALFNNGLSYRIRYDRELSTSDTIVMVNKEDEFNDYMKEIEMRIL